MAGFNASVDNVRASASSSTVVILVCRASALPVGDAGNAPGSTLLLDIGVDGHNTVLLNVIDLQFDLLAPSASKTI